LSTNRVVEQVQCRNHFILEEVMKKKHYKAPPLPQTFPRSLDNSFTKKYSLVPIFVVALFSAALFKER
jgi:hypothetical protein